MIEVTDKVTKIAYLECGVEINKVGEIVVPVINDFFENISFSGNVLSLLFLDNLTLLTYLGLRREKMRLEIEIRDTCFTLTFIATSLFNLTSLARKTEEKEPSPISLPKM